MFLTTEMFFFSHRKSNFNRSARVRTQYFDFHFIYDWKVIHSQKTKLPVAITNITHFSISELENGVFLGFGSLTFYSSCFLLFLLSFLTVKLHCTATLSCTCFWIVQTSGIQLGEETDVGSQYLNRVLKSLFTFTHLVFRTKQGTWHKRIQLVTKKA